MKKITTGRPLFFFGLIAWILPACQSKNNVPARDVISALNLKKGVIVSCGPADQQFGVTSFATSCSAKTQKDVDLAIAMLHSFEYDDAEKMFAKIIEEEPGAAIAYWGVAMSNFHPLWAPPSAAELEKGAKAIAIAQSLTKKTKRESDYIEALAAFYKDRDKTNHLTRCIRFEKAMEKLYTGYPDDKEAAIFYALALNGAADPTDTTFSKQKKGGAILSSLYPGQPDHPGIIHYIIHSYDYPELAALALPAARKYASIAPSSAHAQHMPSHIFTRMGLWDECINSNIASTASAKCYAENTGIKGHWDEELHGMDYLIYAYLQKGDNAHAKEQYDYLLTIDEVYPVNFKVAYAFTAIPARYVLENSMWKEAAALQLYPANFPWMKFPWQKAIYHFTRALGAARTGDARSARNELKNLTALYDTLTQKKETYNADQVLIQVKAAGAWILFAEGKNDDALTLMKEAAGMEDKIQKHPVTPGEVIPVMEQWGDMLLQMNKPGEALSAYEADLKKHPNRFNGLYGAAMAAKKSGATEKMRHYLQQLISIAGPENSSRPELATARLLLQ